MNPLLMPAPNHLRFRPGACLLDARGGAAVDPRALAVFPDIFAALARILEADFAARTESPFQIIWLDDVLIAHQNKAFGADVSPAALEKEGYLVSADEAGITIAARSKRGFLYAFQTLRQLTVARAADSLTIKAADILDAPFLPVRGIHLYLPALEDFDEFKRFAEALSALKYNRIYVETAGMEIKKHPEMNEAWEKFCEDLMETPEKPKLYQATFKFQKDSLHIECCGGKTIAQTDVRALVNCLKSLGFDVIPEVQSLTHCHFLTLAHREIAERPEDPYPDTYCPMNDTSYELLFDVIDEVVDVFEPEILNIGHDEYYSIGVCERCKGMNPADLLAMDVNRIRDYLKAKGVQTEMWADKLVNAYNPTGRGEGGAFKMIDSYEVSKIFEVRGATYAAIEKIPTDVLMGNWFWGVYPHGFERFDRHGFTTTYNNLFGAEAADFDRYARIPSMTGGTCSHWSWVREENMARDGYFFNLVYTAYPLWNSAYTDDSYEAVRDLAVAYLPTFRQRCSGVSLPSRSLYGAEFASVITRHEQHEKYYLDTSFVEIRNFRHTHVDHTPGTFASKIAVYNVPQTFRVGVAGDLADSVLFTHAADLTLPHRLADHGYQIEDYLVGQYTVLYADGEKARVPLYLGKEIGSLNVDWGRKRKSASVFATDILFQQAAYYAVPRLVPENHDGFVTMYEYEWINPRPDVEIREIILSANRLPTPYSLFVEDIRLARRIKR